MGPEITTLRLVNVSWKSCRGQRCSRSRASRNAYPWWSNERSPSPVRFPFHIVSGTWNV